MSFLSSIRVCFHVLAEDVAATRIGAPLGWLFRLHYEGRLAAHTRRVPLPKFVALNQYGRQILLRLSAPYKGAFKGIFLDQEYRCDHLLLQPPARILDIGANIGMGALYLKALFPEAEFVCLEPDPRNLTLLKFNLQENKIQARVENVAAGPKPGMLQLRFGGDPTLSALETSPMHQLEDSVSVTVRTVGDVLDDAGWESADLVKMDIEGAEDELLSVSNDWLSRVNALILEIHPNTSPGKIASYLHPFGFELKPVGFGPDPIYFAARTVRVV